MDSTTQQSQHLQSIMSPPPNFAQATMTEVPLEKPAVMQSQQPGIQPGMSMGALQNPQNVKGLSFDANGERDWSKGLCGCFSHCGTCILGYFCPCIVYSQNYTRLEALQDTRQPHHSGGDKCSAQALLSCFVWTFTGCGWVFDFMNRGDVRKRYHIKGGGCSDCMIAWCCWPCSQVQIRREIEDEENAVRQGLIV